MFIPIEFIISLNVGKEVLILRQFLTVTGVSGDYGKTAELDARIQAIDIWRSDNEGWWNGGRHGLGNIEITTLFLYSHC